MFVPLIIFRSACINFPIAIYQIYAFSRTELFPRKKNNLQKVSHHVSNDLTNKGVISNLN